MSTGWLSPVIVDVLGGRQKFQILVEIHSQGPMTVQELQERLGMSYMGVKQHCDSLEEGGYLAIEKQSIGQGRPRHVYGLTPRGREIFVGRESSLLEDIITAIEHIHGSSGAEKILFHVYKNRTETLWQKVNRYALLRRVREIAAIRRTEGYETRVERSRDYIVISESPQPIAGLLKKFPIVAMLERGLFERLLETRVVRTHERQGDADIVRYEIRTTPPEITGPVPRPKLTGRRRKAPELTQDTALPPLQAATTTQKISRPQATRNIVILDGQGQKAPQQDVQLDLVDYINKLNG